MVSLLHSPRFARKLDAASRRPAVSVAACTCRVDCDEHCQGACGCRACFEAAQRLADQGAAELVVRF